MPNPAARRARRIDRRHRRSSPCAGRFCRRRCAISRAARGPRAGPAQAAAAPLALARRAFWIPFVPAQAGAQDSRLRGNERDYALASNNTSSFPRRVFAPGVCTFASLTRNRGVGGAPRDVRVPAGTRGACHLASKTRVNALMTRHTRRLRGALRPMTRDARLSALHRGGFGPRGRASVSLGARRPTTAGSCLRIRAASSSQPGRSAWRAGSRASRGERLQAAAAGRHSSLRLQDVSGDAPQ